MSLVQKPKIAHLILAAGSSGRMGTPKQLLHWQDNSLIGHAIEQALRLSTSTVYVVLGAYFDRINEKINHFPVEIIKNDNWQLGMGSSIRCGIKGIQNYDLNYDGVLISLIDQPLIHQMHFELLIKKFVKGKSSIVATNLESSVGVPAIFSANYFNDLVELKEDFGARRIIKKYQARVQKIDVIGKSADIDTIEEYKRLIKDHFG